MGAGLHPVLERALAHVAIEVAHRVFVIRRLTSIAWAQLVRAESNRVVSGPAGATTLPIRFGLQVVTVRGAAATGHTALGQDIMHRFTSDRRLEISSVEAVKQVTLTARHFSRAQPLRAARAAFFVLGLSLTSCAWTNAITVFLSSASSRRSMHSTSDSMM